MTDSLPSEAPATPAPLSSDTLTNGQLAVVTIGRLAMITAFRIVYPLQPFLAQHLQVDLRTVSWLITIQALVSLISPLGGIMADSRGERTTMSIGLGLFCGGALFCVFSSSFSGFLVGYAIIGLGIAFYQPAAQAYLSARTSYARRGWSLGVLETSWAAAAILGVAPLMQVVQATNDTTAVFWVLLVVGGASLAMILLALPLTPRQRRQGSVQINWAALRVSSVLAMLLLIGLTLCAYNIFVLVQSAWIKAGFQADESRLGQLFGMVGIAELISSFGAAFIVDRIGKRRSVAIGYVLTIVMILALPFTAGNWMWFLPVFFGYYLFQEFAIVASIPLVSGIAPAVRGTVLSLSVAATGVGSVIGSQVGEPIWSNFGFFASSLVSALLIGGALACLMFVREAEAEMA